jgi:hypothetical protein
MLRKILAALAIIALGVVALPTPAQAAQNCSVDALCFYDTSSSSWPFINHDDSDTSPSQCWTMAAVDRFKASYVRNQTDHKWYWYRMTNCQGGGGPLYAYTSGAISSNQAASYMRVG